MAAGLLLGPWIYNADGDGAPLAGSLLTTYVNNTTTPQATYTTAALSVPHDNPIVADLDGRFPDIWADTDDTFSIRWEDPNGVEIDTYDDRVPLGPSDSSAFALVDLSNVAVATLLAAGEDAALTGQAFRNRLINGNCRINQRNADPAVTLGTSRTYGFDRWGGRRGASQTATLQRSLGGAVDYPYLAAYTCTSGAAAGAADQSYIEQVIEGVHIADALLGSSSARYLAIRFKAQPSLSGKYSFYIQNSARDRSYVFTQTLVGGQFQDVTAIITGDQTGTWLTDTGAGLIFGCDMGCGANFEGAAGAWAAADRRRTADSVSINTTTGRNFVLARAQIAVVDGATLNPAFEERAYAQELALCQRYFWKLNAHPLGITATASSAGGGVKWPVTMRTSPTVGTVTTAAASGSAGTGAVAGTNADGASFYNSAANWSLAVSVTATATVDADFT